MNRLTDAEYAGLLRAREERDRLVRMIRGGNTLLASAHALAIDAREQGLVLTITQRPLTPLAMGNHEPVITLTPGHAIYRGVCS